VSNDDVVRHARLELLKDVLFSCGINEGSHSLPTIAGEILDRLENLDRALIDPPNKVPVVKPLGDERSLKVVDALIRKPEVLYGVLGILHNLKVGSPWKQMKAGGTWIRVDAQGGGALVSLTRDKNNKVKGVWQNVGPQRPPKGTTFSSEFYCDDLAEAMAYADVTLCGLDYYLVPGFQGDK